MGAHQSFGILFGLLIAFIVVALPQREAVHGQEPQEESNSAAPQRGEPILLFDGTSLEGWGNKDDSPNDGWVIQEGVLFRSKRAGHLYYSQEFENFELTFQWKQEEGGNSGVKYRVKDYRSLFYGTRSLGCEFQCIANEKNSKTSSGSLYALYAPDTEQPKLNPAGEWNSGKIVVNEQEIQHWLNDELVVRAQVGGPDWLERVAGSKFSIYKNFGQNRTGKIFLQDHGDPVWFRNIVLTPLEAPAELDLPLPPESQLPELLPPEETVPLVPIETGFLRDTPFIVANSAWHMPIVRSSLRVVIVECIRC